MGMIACYQMIEDSVISELKKKDEDELFENVEERPWTERGYHSNSFFSTDFCSKYDNGDSICRFSNAPVICRVCTYGNHIRTYICFDDQQVI